MKKLPCFIVILLLYSSLLFSQVSINSSGDPPHGSAMLDVSSTTKGFLPPNMTQAQRTAIINPVAGLLVYQTDSTAGYYYYTGENWVSIESTGAGSNSTSTCIDYDGTAYPTMTIGSQVWMAENLLVTHYRNGDAIPNVTENTAWAALTTGAYCGYDNDLDENGQFGALYNWYTVNDSRGLCPTGWHMPSDAEWTTLAIYFHGESVGGGKMKSISAFWEYPNTNATNNSGFSGLPGGYRGSDGSFYGLNYFGYWWSSTALDDGNAWFRNLRFDSSGLFHYYDVKEAGYSVRCLRDN